MPGHAGATGTAHCVIENRGAIDKVGMTFQKDVEQHVTIEEQSQLQSAFSPQFFEAGSALAGQLAASCPLGREGRLIVTARRLAFEGLVQKMSDQTGKGGAPTLGRLLGAVVDGRIQSHGNTFFHYAYYLRMCVLCQPARKRRSAVLESERPREPHGDLQRPGTAAFQRLIEALDGPDKIPLCHASPR